MDDKNKLISLKDVKTYEVNPFVVELKGKMYLQPRANMILARGQGIHNTQTGEILEDTPLIGKRKIVDKSQFAKIYASEIGILHQLSKAAILVFMHLSKIMDFENKAIFDYKKQYSKIGYKTEVSALNGIRELITKNIIAPHVVSGIWWLNPVIVCKGERFAKYTEYITEEEAKREEEQMMKEQNRKVFSSLGPEVRNKLEQAREKNLPIDENNNVIPFEDINPFKKNGEEQEPRPQPRQTTLEEQIKKAENEREEE